MDIIEKIKAEIKSRIEFHNNAIKNNAGLNVMSLTHAGGLKEDEYLLSFLSTLEPEKPMQEGLDEEINRTYHDGSVTDTSDLDHNSYENIARHFAKWGAEHTPLPEDTVLFNKGVEEGKRLMMDEAVEGEVVLNPYPTICLDDCKDYDFNEGDNVRIIIVKED